MKEFMPALILYKKYEKNMAEFMESIMLLKKL